MPCYDEGELAIQIGTCITPANKADVIRILADLCESITAIEDMFIRLQRNTNNAVTDMVADTQTSYELDDLIVREIPLGSFSPDTITLQFDGLYRIKYTAKFYSNGDNNKNCELRIKVNGTNDIVEDVDSAAVTVTISDEVYRRLQAGDLVTAFAVVDDSDRTSELTLDIEYMLP